jgi:hypothetical protein
MGSWSETLPPESPTETSILCKAFAMKNGGLRPCRTSPGEVTDERSIEDRRAVHETGKQSKAQEKSIEEGGKQAIETQSHYMYNTFDHQENDTKVSHSQNSSLQHQCGSFLTHPSSLFHLSSPVPQFPLVVLSQNITSHIFGLGILTACMPNLFTSSIHIPSLNIL